MALLKTVETSTTSSESESTPQHEVKITSHSEGYTPKVSREKIENLDGVIQALRASSKIQSNLQEPIFKDSNSENMNSRFSKLLSNIREMKKLCQ